MFLDMANILKKIDNLRQQIAVLIWDANLRKQVASKC